MKNDNRLDGRLNSERAVLTVVRVASLSGGGVLDNADCNGSSSCQQTSLWLLLLNISNQVLH